MTLKHILAGALVALAGGSIYMSWGALYEFALATGMPPARAVAFPAIIDVVTVVAMLIALYVDLPKSTKAYPWIALALFGAVTIAGNALHVVTVPSAALRVDEWVAVIANALPAVALMVTTHLAAVTVFQAAPQPAEAAEVAPAAPEAAGGRVVLEEVSLESEGRAMIPAKREDREALVLALAADGLKPPAIHRQTGIATSTIHRYLSKAQPA